MSPCLPWEYDPRELDPSPPLKKHLRAEGPVKSSRYVYTWVWCVAVPPLLRCTEMSEIRTSAPCGPTACRRWPRFSTIFIRFVHTGQLYQADRTLSVAKLCAGSLLVCLYTLALISECPRYTLVNTFDRGCFRRTAPCRFLSRVTIITWVFRQFEEMNYCDFNNANFAKFSGNIIRWYPCRIRAKFQDSKHSNKSFALYPHYPHSPCFDTKKPPKCPLIVH